MKKIIRTIWSIYAAIVMAFFVVIYVVTCLIGLFIFGAKAEKFLLRFGYKFLARIVSALILVRYQSINRLKEIPDQACVLVSNHRSIIDVFANEITSPKIFKFLSKKQNEKIPAFGLVIKRLCIPIARKDKESRQKSFEVMAANLKAGMSVLIYPEGTRNRTADPLKPFYDGAFRLAIGTKTPILVQTLIGTDKITNPLKRWDLAPGLVTCYWDGPFYTDDLHLSDLDALKANIRTTMLNNLNTGIPATN